MQSDIITPSSHLCNIHDSSSNIWAYALLAAAAAAARGINSVWHCLQQSDPVPTAVGLKKFLKKNVVGDTLAVLDAKLGSMIKEKLEINCVHKYVNPSSQHDALVAKLAACMTCNSAPNNVQQQ